MEITFKLGFGKMHLRLKKKKDSVAISCSVDSHYAQLPVTSHCLVDSTHSTRKSRIKKPIWDNWLDASQPWVLSGFAGVLLLATPRAYLTPSPKGLSRPYCPCASRDRPTPPQRASCTGPTRSLWGSSCRWAFCRTSALCSASAG